MPKKRKPKAKPKDYAAGDNFSVKGQLETTIDGSLEQQDTRGRGKSTIIVRGMLMVPASGKRNGCPVTNTSHGRPSVCLSC